MFGDGIKNGIYKVAENNTLKHLKLVQVFLMQQFSKI